MNRILALFFLFLVGCTAGIQSPGSSCRLATINIVDRNGVSETISNPERIKQYEQDDFLAPHPYEKVLRIYSRDNQGNIRSLVTSYHENGQIRQYLEVVNTRAFGAYREWHPNGKLSVDSTVIGGEADLTPGAENSFLFEGCSRAWDENGAMLAQIWYSKGLLEGVSTYFYPTGELYQQIPYHQGKIEGTLEIFFQSGEVMQQANYTGGVAHGPATRYWQNGSIAGYEEFEEGLLMHGVYYTQSGEQIAKIVNGNGYRALFARLGNCELQEYQNGVQEGEVQIFGTSGELISVCHLKNGMKHGEEVQYYDPKLVSNSPQPKLSVNWYEDKIQGFTKTWYPNGTQESQREMSNNLKNGLYTAWYKDGSLMMIEEYEKDRLVKGEYFRKGEKYPVSQVRDQKGLATMFDPEGNFLHKVNYFNGVPVE